jgi:transcriptional regulator GlxA family with amidase domain
MSSVDIHMSPSVSSTVEGRFRSPRDLVHRLDAVVRGRDESHLRVQDLASAMGVSSRTVYRVFARHRGVPPISYLREVRLEHVRGRLLLASARETVTSAALDFGFSHLGRFAVLYRRRFGERPSDTLRRGRSIRRVERAAPPARVLAVAS